MRYSSRKPQQQVDRAIDALTALADTGVRHVEIRRVLAWLGVAWEEPEPGGQPPVPGADPMTGCAPVTADREPA